MRCPSTPTLLPIALALLASCKSSDLYGGIVTVTPSFEVVDASLEGISIGWEGHGPKGAGFMEIRAVENPSQGLDVVDFVLGGRFPFWRDAAPLQVGFQVDVGIGYADLASLANGNDLLSVGAALFAQLKLSSKVALYTTAGTRQYWDTTPPTTCNDGTASQSTGSGTCSHHGGINHYNEYIGDGGGEEFSVGIRVYL